MHIRSFHIDSFGLLKDVSVKDLPTGLSIFLGQNEAGKSTLLDFFRSTLAGYPAKTRHVREKAYVAHGQRGGSLDVQTPFGALRLTRRPEMHISEPSLVDMDGKPLESSIWHKIMAGITREVYTNIYGFSLRELQEFATLTGDEVRQALYGASFGTGLHSPSKVLHSLNGHMHKLFKPSGSNPALSKKLKEWEDISRQLRTTEDALQRYDAMALESKELAALLEAEQQEYQSIAKDKRTLERRLSVWRQWEEWRMASMRLNRLEPVPLTFPQDGPARLDRAQIHVNGAEQNLHTALERLHKVRTAYEACTVNETMLAALAPLRSLVDHKATCRQAMVELQSLEQALDRIEKELAQQLATLGNGWDLERVQAVSCSLPQREVMTRTGENIQRVLAAHDLAMQAKDEAERTLQDADMVLQEAKAAHDAIAEPAPVVAKELRASLYEQCQNVQQALYDLPEKEKTLLHLRTDLAQKLDKLHLAPAQKNSKALQRLTLLQDQALLAADELLQKEKQTAHAQQEAERIAKQAEQAHDDLEHLQDRLQKLNAPDPAIIAEQKRALKRIRHVLYRFHMEKDRRQGIMDSLSQHVMYVPDSGKRPMFIGFGALIMALGVGLLFALQMGVTTLPLTATLTVPLSLGQSIGLLVAGFLSVLFGLPNKKNEVQRHAAREAQLNKQLAEHDTNLQKLKQECADFCNATGCQEVREQDLDDFESHLEEERERLILHEQLCADIQAKTKNIEDISLAKHRQDAIFQQCRDEENRTKKRLHELFLANGFERAPDAEHISTIFAHIDSALGTSEQVDALEQNIEQLYGQCTTLKTMARKVLPLHAHPASWTDDEQVLLAAKQALEACAQADTILEQRKQKAETMQLCDTQVQREKNRVAEMSQNVINAKQELASIQEAWQNLLESMGLDPNITVSTAQEALRCVDTIRSLLNEQQRLHEALAHNNRVRQHFVEPLQTIAQRLQHMPEKLTATLATGKDILHPTLWTAWQSLHDALMAKAEEADNTALERARLKDAMADEEHAANTAKALLNEAEQNLANLLRQGEAQNPDDFLRRHALQQEREELLRRYENAEDALRLAHHDDFAHMSFADFVQGFSAEDQEELEQQVATYAGRMSVLTKQREQHRQNLHTLGVQLEQMRVSDEVVTLRLQQAGLNSQLQQLAQEWSKYAIAHHLIATAKRRFEQERQPEVIQAASRLFAAITGGEWIRINASLEDNSLMVLPATGEPVLPEMLSRGTQEQLYLSLRLAHICNHATHNTPLPVIMDDILVNFDPVRAQHTAKVLANLVQTNDKSQDMSTTHHQLFFFTCHPHIATMLHEQIPNSGIYQIERGAINTT